MIALSFGNCCYNSYSEEGMMIVIASKKEYASMDEFVDKAIVFLNSDGEFYDNYEEMYRNRIYTPVMYDIDSDFAKINNRVGFLHEPIIRAYHLVDPKWNDITLLLETEYEYILYNWGTAG